MKQKGSEVILDLVEVTVDLVKVEAFLYGSVAQSLSQYLLARILGQF